MDDVESILNGTIDTNFVIQASEWVTITQITNPLDFYVRPTKYWPLIERWETTQPQIKPSSLNINDIIMYNNSTSDDPKYVRGKIFGIKRSTGDITKYDIYALDYGNFSKAIPEGSLWECNHLYVGIPELAVACQLSNCSALVDDEWSEDSIDAFTCYIGDERASMLVLDKTMDKLVVELRNSSPNDIATLMSLTGYSALGYGDNESSPSISEKSKTKYFTYKKFHVKDTLRVRVASGRSIRKFFVMDVNDYKTFVEERHKFTFYGAKQPKLPEDNMKKKTVILLKNASNMYDRAIIQEIIVPNSTAKVKLVDSGKQVVANIRNMKTMADVCMNLPVATIQCSIGRRKKKNWDHVLCRNLNPGFEFIIDIEKLGNRLDCPYRVKCEPLPYNPRR